ncbi:hypothetical protein B0A49_13237, partial [Cryomyces minteri]
TFVEDGVSIRLRGPVLERAIAGGARRCGGMGKEGGPVEEGFGALGYECTGGGVEWSGEGMSRGGIRGLSELKILEEIMNRIKFDLRMEDDPLPADFFDLIGGTSTGGLIALLLGRLRLSVPQARNAFVKIAKDVFSIQRYLREGRFNEKKLEEAVKGLLRVKFGADRGEERMLDRPDAACKVFVCTVAAKDIGARAGPR